MKKLPESELDIMMIIWKSNQPVSVAYILERIEKHELTLSALHSYLNRLVEKNFIICQKQGKNNMYSSIVSEDEYLKSESNFILKKLYGGSLTKFVAALYNGKNISPSDIKELKDYIKQFSEEE